MKYLRAQEILWKTPKSELMKTQILKKYVKAKIYLMAQLTANYAYLAPLPKSKSKWDYKFPLKYIIRFIMKKKYIFLLIRVLKTCINLLVFYLHVEHPDVSFLENLEDFRNLLRLLPSSSDPKAPINNFSRTKGRDIRRKKGKSPTVRWGSFLEFPFRCN